MIALILQAAAEYVGVMIANGMRGASAVAGEAVQWSRDNLWVIGVALVALALLRKLIPRRRSS